MAKKKRAELNTAKQKLTRSRIDLVKELMKPYEDFENRCKALEKKVDTASGYLDEIVKAKEQEEKDNKRNAWIILALVVLLFMNTFFPI